MLITVSTELGLDNETTKIAFCPSFTIGLLMLIVGVGSLSIIVLVPLVVTVLVLVEVTVPDKVNVSFSSSIKSSIVGTLTVAVVCPAGIVTVITEGVP